MSDTYKLQLRHGAETKNFSTRDEVIGYINGQLQYGGVSLLPYEPILFFYGADDAKNAIIMVGLPEGKTQNGNSYFLVDTADLKAQIESLDSQYDDILKSLKAEDEKIWEAVNQESQDRIDADEAEAIARGEKDAELENAIADETEARVKKDEELQEAIDFTKADLMSVIEACGLVYNEMLAEGRVSYTPDIHDEVIRDAKTVAEAIDKISKFATKLGQDIKFSVTNSDTVNLILEPNEKDGGNTLTAEVKIAGTEGLSKKNFDNNIMGKTSEGLYASVSVEPSALNPNVLIFRTSGYIDGQFKVDAFETEVPLAAYKGDNGKNTGITVTVDADKNLISGELNLASGSTNILKLEDGEYVVEGTAKNIKYKDTTVLNALNTQSARLDEIEDSITFVKAVNVNGTETDTTNVTVEKSVKGDFTVSSDVRLSTDKSIIVADGGLKANISAAFKKGTSTLLIEVGNNEYAIDLSDLAVSVLKGAEYDAGTEELVLEFIVGDVTKTIRIPVGTLIHDVEVDDTDTIDMTLRGVSGGPNHISAAIRVDNSHSDNILTVNSNGVYVSKAFITEAVNEESEARKAVDDELKAKIDKVTELANANKEAIVEEANTARAAENANAMAIEQEIKDARAAEAANAKAIADNAKVIKENEKTIADEVLRASNAEQANANAIIAEESRASAAELRNAEAIASEINRATEKENSLLEKIGDNTTKINENKTAIAAEVERSTKADAEIRSSVEANASAIDKEVDRAKTAEGELATKVTTNTENIASVQELAIKVDKALDAEIIRAKAAEEANATAVMAESNRAKAAEADLASKITTSTEDATAAKELATKVDKALESEITRATAAEEANATAIQSEMDRAKTAEGELAAKIEKNTNDVTSAKELASNVDKALDAEIIRAKAAEADIASKITTSTEDATSAKELAIKVDKALDAEIIRAKAAEGANATAIQSETDRATHAEADLLEKINKNISDIQAVSTEIGNIELRKEGDLYYALYVQGVKHGEFIIPKDQFLKEVAYDSVKKELVFVFITSVGEVTTKISISDLVDTYVAGEGLSLNGNMFSVDFAKVASVEKVNDVSTKLATTQNELKTVSDKVNSNTTVCTNLNYSLNNEINRAIAAEKVLTDAIAAEEARATAAELELRNATTSNANEIAANKKAISDEQLRATTAEASLNTSITEVSGKVDSAKELLTASIKEESDRAKEAERVINARIDGQSQEISAIKTNLSNSITEQNAQLQTVKSELTSEINKKANIVDVYTKEEILDKLSPYAKTSDVQSKLDEKLNVTDAQNIYATKEALQKVKDDYATNEKVDGLNDQITARLDNDEDAIDNFNLSYNEATSELAYTDKNGTVHTYKLYSGSLIKKGEFDPLSNSIVLTIENAGIESQITIPVSQLLSDLSDKITANTNNIQKINEAIAKLAKDWEVKSSATVDLSKSTVGEKDILTATVRVASSNKQAIQSTGDGLYVSNDLEDYTCVFGAEGTISAQTAISKLLEKSQMENDFDARITANANEIARLKAQVATNTDNIGTLKTDVQDTKSEVSSLKNQVGINTNEIAALKNQFNELDTKVDALDGRLATAEGNITTLTTRIETVEGDITVINGKLAGYETKFGEIDKAIEDLRALINGLIAGGGDITALSAEIEKIKTATGYNTYANPKNMSTRLDDIEANVGNNTTEINNIKNNMIGSKESPAEGSIWHELNNIVDAGMF